MAGKIFINYRRDDARAEARNVREHLAQAFGATNVFMDVNDLKPGQHFDEELKAALSECDVFLAIIGRRWLDLLSARNISGETDYVRAEIAGALSGNRLVIPILVDTAALPAAARLPDDIKPLVFRQKHELTHEKYSRDVGELIDTIKSHQAANRPGRARLRVVATVVCAVLFMVAALTALGLNRMGILDFGIGTQGPAHVADLKPGKVFRDCANCPEMVVLPAGAFTMGSPDNEPGHKAVEAPLHHVALARAFAIGKTEITVKQYEDFVTETGGVSDGGGCAVWTAYGHRFDKERNFRTPSFSQLPSHPVVCVSWQAATTYGNWLTSKTGQKYRLLTEAEWEYAARGNTTTRYHFGDDEAKLCDYGNGADRTSAFLWGNHLCSDNVGVQTAEVGRYRPNAFGLHDMLGNAAEWVQDCLHPDYQGAPADGAAWMDGDCKLRVIRGGAWDNSPTDMRSASRGGAPMQARDTIGFRVAREIR